jgi:hypothetical protein
MKRWLALLLMSCTPKPPPLLHADLPASPPLETTVVDAGLAPLEGYEWLHPIGANGRDIARVSMPLGSTTTRPWMVALHGAGDRAEWSCGEWRAVSGAYPFIVCPRGDASGYYWGKPKDTTTDIGNAIGALRETLPERIASGDARIVAGFSMGATEALLVLRWTDLPAPRSLVLVEGGYDTMQADPLLFKTLKQKGVTRLLLGCTTLGFCARIYKDAKASAEKSGIETHFVQAARGDHGMYQEVTESLSHEWPWITEGLEGWPI